MKLNMSIYLILHLLVSINAYTSFTPRILHVPTTWKWKRLLNFSFFHPSPEKKLPKSICLPSINYLQSRRTGPVMSLAACSLAGTKYLVITQSKVLRCYIFLFASFFSNSLQCGKKVPTSHT